MVRVPATLSQNVRDELGTHYLRIKPFVSAARLWERVLTDQERLQLGGELGACYTKYGSVGMWQNVRGGSDERAVLEISMALGYLTSADYQWLLREIGDNPIKTAESTDVPAWAPEEGKLRLAGKVIRSVRIYGRPSNVQIILDAFQKAEWPRQIRNPLRLGQQSLHLAVRSLNSRLKEIRFRSRGGGQTITWEKV